jgi:hypothetical protein
MTQNQLLELVIGDIGDVHVKTATFNSNVKSEAGLLVLLSNYKMTNKAPVSHNKLKRGYPFELKSNDAKLCFKIVKNRETLHKEIILDRNLIKPKSFVAGAISLVMQQTNDLQKVNLKNDLTFLT